VKPVAGIGLPEHGYAIENELLGADAPGRVDNQR
jgi:hypothetical protein